jgi:hypothetical protein
MTANWRETQGTEFFTFNLNYHSYITLYEYSDRYMYQI